ncbi:STN domain-containing protein, partial [Pseudomonas putida]|uniref:STN domain-containing protein n=1 Tax=Pseudomonas putida TaxID=303 RepID=UPI0005B99210
MRRFPGHPVLSPLALALRLSCAGLALSVAALPAVAEEAARRSFDVPAGNLAQALGSYAQQAAVSLAFIPEALAGLQSNGLHGLYSVDSGFAVLLAGSGYR